MICAWLTRGLTPLLLLFSSYVLAQGEAGTYVPPEKATTVVVSSKDVNRINCPVDIQEVFWSNEKPAVVTYEGKNAFVKFKAMAEGSKLTYAKQPLDVHIVCADEVYTVIMIPQDINAVTLRLGNQERKLAAETIESWGGMPLEEQLKKFTLAMYRDDIPAGFKTESVEVGNLLEASVVVHGYGENQHQPVRLAAIARKRIRAPGLGMVATEYSVYAPSGATLAEKDFLKMEFGKSIVAITIDKPLLRPQISARVFIINRSVTDGDY